MPSAKLLDKDAKEVKIIDFKSTGKPLPRIVNSEGIDYQFERKIGTIFVYKQES